MEKKRNETKRIKSNGIELNQNWTESHFESKKRSFDCGEAKITSEKRDRVLQLLMFGSITQRNFWPYLSIKTTSEREREPKQASSTARYGIVRKKASWWLLLLVAGYLSASQ